MKTSSTPHDAVIPFHYFLATQFLYCVAFALTFVDFVENLKNCVEENEGKPIRPKALPLHTHIDFSFRLKLFRCYSFFLSLGKVFSVGHGHDVDFKWMKWKSNMSCKRE